MSKAMILFDPEIMFFILLSFSGSLRSPHPTRETEKHGEKPVAAGVSEKITVVPDAED